MKIVLSGGGTAGHVNPALALAEELQERGHEVLYAGTPDRLEATLVPQAGIPFKAFESAGFDRSHPASLVRAFRLIAKSTAKAKKWFAQEQPDCVVCFGGYVCIPVGRAAAAMRIPLVLHEGNSIMGLANKYLAKRADVVAYAYEGACTGKVDPGKLVGTGNPVRRQVLSSTREEGRAYCQVPEDARFLVVFGGSLGAQHVNSAICAAKDMLLARPDLHVRQITGARDYDMVVEQLQLTEEEAQRWRVIEYEDSMGKVLAAADMVVSRAGSTSLAEISALGIPALLIPFPHARAGEQTQNAREYADRGAAIVFADEDIDGPEFLEALENFVADDEARARMHEAAASFETADAASKLADIVTGS